MKAHSYLIAMLLSLVAGTAHAQDTLYWTGAVSTEWGNPGNWTGPSSVGVPGPTVTVIIDPPTFHSTALETDYGIAELIISGNADVACKHGSLTVDGDVTLTAGSLNDNFGNPVTVYGSVRVFGGKLYINDTLTVGGDFVEEATVPLSTIANLRFTGNAFYKPQTGPGNVIIDGGAFVTLGNTVVVNGTLRNDGTVFLNANNIVLSAGSPSALSGTGGLTDTLTPAFGIGNIIWRVAANTGMYVIPFHHRFGGPMAPLEIDVTGAGTGTNGRVIGTNVPLTGTQLSLVASQLDVFRDAEGGSNLPYNANHLWYIVYQDYSAIPGATYTIRYDETDLAGKGIDESRLVAQCLERTGDFTGKWHAPSGIVDTAANTVTVTGLPVALGIWALVDSTSPNRNTYGGKTGLTCAQAIELDSLNGNTVFEMQDTVMWFRFEATDTFMHVFAGAHSSSQLVSLLLYRNACDSIIPLGDTTAASSTDHLILNEGNLEIGNAYLIRLKKSGTFPVVLKGPITMQALLPPVAPSSLLICSDTMAQYTFGGVECGLRGDQIEWSHFSSFAVSETLSSPGSIYSGTRSGVQDTVWMRSRNSFIKAVSLPVFTTVRVSPFPNPPGSTPIQYVISDTAVEFTFDSIYAGGGGTHIEWSFDSLYTTSNLANSPASVSFEGLPGTTTAFWLRSVDSLSGCRSVTYNGIGIVDTLEDERTRTDTVVSVCYGGSWEVCVGTGLPGHGYSLLNGGEVVDSATGNGGGLCLSSGTVDSVAYLRVRVTDTLGTAFTYIDTLIMVVALDAQDTVDFHIDGLLLEAGDTFQFNAMSRNGSAVAYDILYGGAIVDSATGKVHSITSSFTVRACTVGSPCDTAYADLFVNVTPLGTPIRPEPIVMFVDSADTVEVVFHSVLAGNGGDRIEWSEDRDFLVSHTVNVPADISISVPVATERGLWIRTRSTTSDYVSKAVFTSARVSYKQLSAGLLDKSLWDLSHRDTWQLDMDYLYPVPGNNQQFMSDFALNFIADWQANPSGTPAYCPNHRNPFTHFKELYNYGNLDGSQVPDGQGEEVLFSDGMAIITATKLPNGGVLYECMEDSSFVTEYTYQSGMIHRRQAMDFRVPGMLEIRCKLPAEEGIWPAFWAPPGPVEIDVFDNSAGPKKIKTFIHNVQGDTVRRPSCYTEMQVRTACDLSEDWHAFNFLWSETEMMAFLDGKEYWSVKRQIPGEDDYPGVFDFLNVLVNLQAPAWVSGDEYRMYVDHMRYYKPKAGVANCDIAKASLQNRFGCTPLSLEHISSTGHNNHNNVVSSGNLIPLSLGAGFPKPKLRIVNSGGYSSIFWPYLNVLTNKSDRVFIASHQSGHWKVAEMLYRPYLSFRLSDGVVPANHALAYGPAVSSTGLTHLAKMDRANTTDWYGSLIVTPAGCAGDINLTANGNVFFRGGDGNVYVYSPQTKKIHQVTSDGQAAGGLRVHSSGGIMFFRDHASRLRGYYNFTPLPGTSSVIVSNLPLTDEMVLDEKRSRLYFIATDSDVYYYDYGCLFGCGPSPGAVKLGCGSKESKNNASVCSASSNAVWNLSISPDGNMLYYIGEGPYGGIRVWNYYNDRENTGAAYENWNKTCVTPGYDVTTMAVDGSSGFIYAVPSVTNSPYMADVIRELSYTSADNPVLNCWGPDSFTVGAVHKTLADGAKPPLIDVQPVLLDEVRVGVHPNPSGGRFTFTVAGVPQGQAVELVIMDLAGKTYHRSTEVGGLGNIQALTWDADNHSAGYYIYRITVGGNRQVFGKLVKL